MSKNYEMVAVTLNDGSVGIMQFLTAGRWPTLPHGAIILADGTAYREPSTENIFAELIRTYTNKEQQPVSFKIIDESSIPDHRTFRDAWKHDPESNTIVHDMDKARAIHLGRLRAARARAFEQLDAEWMRATGQGDKDAAAKIEERRKVLRDLPANLGVDKAQTVADLAALTHPELPMLDALTAAAAKPYAVTRRQPGFSMLIAMRSDAGDSPRG